MSLLRSAATVGGMTLISRVLGFIRDVLIGGALGTGPVADAFVVAFRFPNLFRRFFAEGAFNSAFVPLFAKRMEAEGADAARQFAEESLSVLLVALIVLTLIAEIAMPFLMIAMAPGFVDDPARFDLSVLFTRIALPYLLCMSLVALFSGILNSIGRFSLPALAPVLLNVILIGALLFAAPHLPSAGHALVWGVALAGFAQLGLVAFGCARSGMVLRLRMPKLTPGVRQLLALGVPGVIAGGITQINLVVGQFIASFQDGAVSILYYADRVYQLPLGLIGVAMGVVLLPDIARRLRGGDRAGALDSQNRALELSMLLTLPAAVACAVVALPIITVLFEATSRAFMGDSAFTAEDSRRTAGALAAFAFGLPAFVLIKVFQPAYFAREDTATPMRFAAVNTVVNIVLGVILFRLFGIVGLAAATSMAAWVNTGLLYRGLSAQGDFEADGRLRRVMPRIGLASVGMGLALLAVQAALGSWMAGGYVWQVAGLCVLVLGGVVVFAVLAQLLGAARLGILLADLRGRPHAMDGMGTE
ncbi:MAG: murein biosynthesis integral membrane protein MurJ [Alphaproteobacteria bacterium]